MGISDPRPSSDCRIVRDRVIGSFLPVIAGCFKQEVHSPLLRLFMRGCVMPGKDCKRSRPEGLWMIMGDGDAAIRHLCRGQTGAGLLDNDFVGEVS